MRLSDCCFLRSPPSLKTLQSPRGSHENHEMKNLKVGNGRNTVSRVLFRKRELTEFCGKLGRFCEELGEFVDPQIKGRKELTEFAPRNSVRGKSSLSSVFEAALSETVFGPFLKFESHLFLKSASWTLPDFPLIKDH